MKLSLPNNQPRELLLLPSNAHKGLALLLELMPHQASQFAKTSWTLEQQAERVARLTKKLAQLQNGSYLAFCQQFKKKRSTSLHDQTNQEISHSHKGVSIVLSRPPAVSSHTERLLPLLVHKNERYESRRGHLIPRLWRGAEQLQCKKATIQLWSNQQKLRERKASRRVMRQEWSLGKQYFLPTIVK